MLKDSERKLTSYKSHIIKTIAGSDGILTHRSSIKPTLGNPAQLCQAELPTPKIGDLKVAGRTDSVLVPEPETPRIANLLQKRRNAGYSQLPWHFPSSGALGTVGGAKRKFGNESLLVSRKRQPKPQQGLCHASR
jgi:hypothetical protein